MSTTKNALEDFHRRIRHAYRTNDTKELVQVYDEWAETYDEDHVAIGYFGPANFAEIISEFIRDKSSRILDVASGTGLVGKELKARGFTCIDALDPSQESLNKSKEHQSYTEYICDTMDEHKTEVSDDHYDAVVICAAFGAPANVSVTCFPELVRITKPGGYVMFTVSDWVLKQWDMMEEAIQAVSRQGSWNLVESRRIPLATHDTVLLNANVIILRMTKNASNTGRPSVV